MPRLPALLLLCAPLLAAAASAHLSHDGCGASATRVDHPLVHVDAWGGSCRGVLVTHPPISCAIDVHADALGAHVVVLDGGGCQTGVLLAP